MSASDESPDLVGRVIAEQYEVEARVGRGGFGSVYRARDRLLDRPVAIKVIHRAATEQLMARFRREARVQARLRHPATTRLLTFGREADGLYYMVQEFVDGRTLKDEVAGNGPLSIERAVSVVEILLEAIAEAHAIDVVHRDVKPSNIMLVDERGRESARLLDFGIAAVLAPDDDTSELTSEGAFIGSVPYVAPEQAEGLPIGPAADLYAIGCTLHYALTGRAPFTGSALEVLGAHLHRPPPILSDAHPLLSAVIGRAMAKSPADRFASAAEMSAALRAARDAEGDRPLGVPGVVSSAAPTLTATVGSRDTTASSTPAVAVDPASSTVSSGEADSVSAPLAWASVGSADASPAPLSDGEAPAAERPASRWIGLIVVGLLGALVAIVMLVARPGGEAGSTDGRVASGLDAGQARSDLAVGGTADAADAADSASEPARDAVVDGASVSADAAAAVDAGAPADSGDTPPADASPAPPPPRPQPSPVARLEGRLARALDRCDCALAGRYVKRVEALDDDRGRRWRSRFLDRCFRPVPGSCVLESAN